jgi:hypothetical protein
MGQNVIPVKLLYGFWNMVDAVTNEKKRWGAEQRLEFIEFRAFWGGGVNRADIIDQFGVSTPQASNDLTAYRTLAPDNLQYDSSAKRYVAAKDFQAKLVSPSAERYLSQLKAVTDGVIDLSDTWIGSPPPAATMPAPRRVVEPELFRNLLAVMRDGSSVQALYQSMNPMRPRPQWRRITPHAFGTDGLRWHVRAHCQINDTFKDFILSRIRGLRNADLYGAAAKQDVDWNTIFNVELEPNPALSEDQRAAVAWEYAMPKRRSILPVRRALLYYLKKRLRLDVPDDSPSETPIVVANRVEFENALASAKGAVAEGEFA